MITDGTLYAVTRPLAILAYTTLLAAFIINIIVLTIIGDSGSDRASTLAWTPLAIAALIVASIMFTRSSVARAITTAMPAGTTVSASLDEDGIQLAAKRGRSVMVYSTFRAMRVGKHAVLLQLRGDSAITAVPRALLSDSDIALLRSKI
ncbi:YcxB family protein [Microbacterium sp. CH12i]|uniref:YcxB family protein n=1 Tax=Microbacterium sp. CH12i TaxID=1479651 RepID=UPI00068ACB1A|nr:YcxB family protein [Microbacterium sp. CH12i]